MNNAEYKRALDAFNASVDNYRNVCKLLSEASANEMHANSALNELISLSWRLKDVALQREPAPLSRAAQRAAEKRKLLPADKEK